MTETYYKYVVIIVKNKEDVKSSVEFDTLKVEYVAIGSQFHGKQFKGTRPTHVIDQTGTKRWFDAFRRSTEDYTQWMEAK